jgi:hypothetical protein
MKVIICHKKDYKSRFFKDYNEKIGHTVKTDKNGFYFVEIAKHYDKNPPYFYGNIDFSEYQRVGNGLYIFKD